MSNNLASPVQQDPPETSYVLTPQTPPPIGPGGSFGRKGGRPSTWARSLAPARAEPGVWFRVEGTHAPGTASYISNGRAAGIAAGEFEATTRSEVDGVHAPRGKTFVFVRYVDNRF